MRLCELGFYVGTTIMNIINHPPTVNSLYQSFPNGWEVYHWFYPHCLTKGSTIKVSVLLPGLVGQSEVSHEVVHWDSAVLIWFQWNFE